MGRKSALLVLSMVWAVAGCAGDHFLLKQRWPLLSSVASFKFTLGLAGNEIYYPDTGLVLLVGVPLVAFAFWCAPWKRMRERKAWISAAFRTTRPLFFLLVAAGLCAMGSWIYAGSKGFLPACLRDFAETASFTVNLSVQGFTACKLAGGVTSIIGLAIGAYLFFSQGLRDVFVIDNEPKHESLS